jgi:uncharacterized protein (TIGR03382 family)
MKSSLHTRLLLVATLFSLASLPVPAKAYVRTVTTATNMPTFWKAACVTMELALGSVPALLTVDEYILAAQAAGNSWNTASLDGVSNCSSVQLAIDPQLDAVSGPVARDSHNRLMFVQNNWCRDVPDPTKACDRDRSALAITTVFQLKSTGEIVESDMEVNGETFTWGDYATHPEEFAVSAAHDFQGAITHELGHVIGLDHTCFKPGTRNGVPISRPVDNEGNPVPDCYPGSALSPRVTDATMYVSVSGGKSEFDMRSLSPDDAQAACEIYPIAQFNGCIPPTQTGQSATTGGCSFSAHAKGGAIAGALALLGLAMVLRRRRV